jgi:hypothetical protein
MSDLDVIRLRLLSLPQSLMISMAKNCAWYDKAKSRAGCNSPKYADGYAPGHA